MARRGPGQDEGFSLVLGGPLYQLYLRTRMEAIASIDDALGFAQDAGELCVIGGGEIFALCLPRATHLHLTHVDTLVEGADAFFPVFDAAQWRVVARESHPADAKHAFAFEFVDYARA